MTMPKQKPGKSKQDYSTPKEFLDAVEERFGKLDVDLACREDNKKAQLEVTEAQDSLGVDWAEEFNGRTMWLNPPYADIGAWVEKCKLSVRGMTSGKIIVLVPASIGANWFEQHVIEKCLVLGVNPRIQFDGTSAPYPKDLMLLVYGFDSDGHRLSGFGIFKWRKNVWDRGIQNIDDIDDIDDIDED